MNKISLSSLEIMNIGELDNCNTNFRISKKELNSKFNVYLYLLVF